MSIFSTIAKALTAIGIASGAAGVGSKIYLKNGHGFGTMSVNTETTKTTTDSNPIPAVPTEELQTPTRRTYGTELTKKDFSLVTANTDEKIVLNILMERLDPTKDSLTHYKGTKFKDSPQVVFKNKTFNSNVGTNSYSLTVVQKPDTSNVDPWRQACVVALDREVSAQVETQGSEEYKELARLREWCTIPTVEHVLRRHKLTPLNVNVNDNKDESDWKEVIGGGWFKKEGDKNNWEDQSFIKDNDLTTIIGAEKTGIKDKSEVTKTHIDLFKNRCKAELEKAFERNNFYLTTQFINGVTDSQKPEIDPFQEVALFCMKPMKASDYIKSALQGNVKITVDTPSTDYCYLSSNDFDNWTTNNPLQGRTFWCAVKLLYAQKGK
ncbi:hypothetical protein [Candidatus Mycoplasma haematohominis]|uniref:hypothetical protein n=1 Tax=Candidatus Mycoplasma haematohominis TaxID=1494318 RepID=UPI001C0A751F|nr:hypothetical protein [Candidatus Mycoplasma haemohominis]